MSSFEKKRRLINFICTKQKRRILIDRKNLCNQSDPFSQLKFSDKIFLLEGMCHENYQLSSKYRYLKNTAKIHSTWFWNYSANVKLNERSQSVNIYHIIDIEKLLGVDDVDNSNEFVKNSSF